MEVKQIINLYFSRTEQAIKEKKQIQFILNLKKEPEYDSDIYDRVEYSNAVKEIYDGIENFDDYFGDTLTFELHYKNGTTKTVIVNISLDKYGKYIINYSIN